MSYEKPEPREKSLYEADPDKFAELYLAYLGLRMEDLEGKKVLEIGPFDGKFAKIAQEKGIDIVAMEGNYNVEPQSGDVKNIYADAETNFPFKDEVFDVLISRYAPPTTIGDKNTVRLFFKEAMRVLKPGGRLVFTMIPRTYFDDDLLPLDDDPQLQTKEGVAQKQLEADIGLPIEREEIRCQNINIGNKSRPEHTGAAFTVKKK